MKSLTLTFVLISTSGIFAAPPNPHDFIIVPGGLVDIPGGSYVEGSHVMGGIQPDYYIDTESKTFKKILLQAKTIGAKDLEFWEKIEKLSDYISELMPGKEYDDKNYRKVIQKFSRKNAPLSKYVDCGGGVCREHALITHQILKEAGIPNFHVYVQVQHGSGFASTRDYITEDHAFVVVKHQGKLWTVDPYNWGFQGFNFNEFFDSKGITASSESAPIASREFHYRRRIVKVNTFPQIWIPAHYSKSIKAEKIMLPDECEVTGFRIRNRL